MMGGDCRLPLPGVLLPRSPHQIVINSAHEYGLSVAMGWGIAGFILLFVYMIIQKRMMGGKIDGMNYGHP